MRLTFKNVDKVSNLIDSKLKGRIKSRNFMLLQTLDNISVEEAVSRFTQEILRRWRVDRLQPKIIRGEHLAEVKKLGVKVEPCVMQGKTLRLVSKSMSPLSRLVLEEVLIRCYCKN